jgi:hypothetical protein
MQNSRLRLWFLLLIAPLLYLSPLLADPTGVHAAPAAEYSDLVVAHWPSAELVRRSLAAFGEIPMWNPYVLGGTPFAADPLSGMYYPPLWLALVLPAPLAFNLLFFAHLALAGVGAYRLARAEGCSPVGALLAGIAFGGLPKLAAHTAAGHLTLVMAVAWTPWLLLAVRDAARSAAIRRWALAGILAGLIFLTDPRWSLPAGLAAVAYAVVARCGVPWTVPLREKIFHWGSRFLFFAGFGLAVAAVLAVPMAQFVSLSTRAGLSPADGTVQSLPFLSLLGLVFGGIGGSAEWVVYPGAAVLFLAFAVLPALRKSGAAERGNLFFWSILFLVCVLLALGSNLPGLGGLANAVPGWNLLRVPPRWMFLAGLALAMLAGRGLSGLESDADEKGILKKGGFALAAAGFMLAAAAVISGWPAALFWDGLVWGSLGVVLLLCFSSNGGGLFAGAAIVCLTVIDLAMADSRMIDPQPLVDPALDPAWTDPLLAAEPGSARIYSPSASVPQLVAVENGWRLLDGVNPLILRSTAAVVSRAAGVQRSGYSVALPAFASGDPHADNRDAHPDPRLLQLLNVGVVAASFDVAGLSGPRRLEGIVLYALPGAEPRAWIAPSLEAWDQPSAEEIPRLASASPNRLRWTAEGPGVLIVAEAAYPAWRATVDGEAAELKTAGGWWRAVELGAGVHTVEMTYDPILSGIGLAITGLALLAFPGVRRWAR